MIKIKKNLGQSLVEFSLLLPLFLILVMGLFDIGRAVLYYAILNTAAREGTRFAIVQSDCDYRSNPLDCYGDPDDPPSPYIDTSYPLTCDEVQSIANQNICNEIKSKFFNIDDLFRSTITINHLNNSNGDPLINIGIELAYQPFTPGLGLVGNINLNTESEMMRTPGATP